MMFFVFLLVGNFLFFHSPLFANDILELGKKIGKEINRVSKRINKEVSRVLERAAREARRTGRRIEEELERSGKKTISEFDRFGKKLLITIEKGVVSQIEIAGRVYNLHTKVQDITTDITGSLGVTAPLPILNPNFNSIRLAIERRNPYLLVVSQAQQLHMPIPNLLYSDDFGKTIDTMTFGIRRYENKLVEKALITAINLSDKLPEDIKKNYEWAIPVLREFILESHHFATLSDVFRGGEPEVTCLLSKTTLSPHRLQEAREIAIEIQNNWLDRHGFLNLKAPSIEVDSENAFLYTSTYYFLMKKLGLIDVMPKILDVKTMIGKTRIAYGLFNRFPDPSRDQDFSRDEHIGLITMDWAYDYQIGVARELFNYGKTTNFYYENRPNSLLINTREKLAGQRFPNFVEYLRMANNLNPTTLGQFHFRTALKLTKRQDVSKTSTKILAYLRFQVMGNKTNSADQAILGFHSEMRKQYGNHPFRELIKIYYSPTDHPIIKLASYLEQNTDC